MKGAWLSLAVIAAVACQGADLHAKVVVALSPLSTVAGLENEQTAVSSIMQAKLSESQLVTLVDREQLHKVLDELKLGQQGMVTPESARQLGSIVGARYFCSGSIERSGDKIIATVRVIDIQTTLIKLTYAFLPTGKDAETAGQALADGVEKLIGAFEKERVEREKETADQAAKQAVKLIPEEWRRPVVMVIVRELHVRQPQLIDPAGETEITKRLIADGFKVVDSEYVHLMKTDQITAKRKFGTLKTSAQYAASKGVDVLLYGEAVSERAATLGDFEGCRARVELKAIRVESDEILLADSATGGATDLAETVAGKKAIQNAANTLSDSFLYSLAEKWNQPKR